jgi:8-oxo-dGTP diphosphatase
VWCSHRPAALPDFSEPPAPYPAPSRRAVEPRAAAVVVDGDQVLVMKRHKRGRDYAVRPGGGVEEGETAAEAALRELHEETTLVADIDRLLWSGRHNDRPAWYFLMTAQHVRGRAELSGPEALANRPDTASSYTGSPPTNSPSSAYTRPTSAAHSPNCSLAAAARPDNLSARSGWCSRRARRGEARSTLLWRPWTSTDRSPVAPA